ncbi:unnamed protein product [Trichobilharzia regenti]|nr:unnamed protein product [Trichobilharzia regenti]
MKRFKDENQFAYLLRYSSKNSTEVDKLKQPQQQQQQQPHHHLDADNEFKLILGAEELEITLFPVSEVEILSSSLYSACASITQITDCNTSTFRPCHSTTNKTGALLNQKKHKSARESIRKHNCELCRHQVTSMPHCATACLAFSSILQTAFRQYQCEHQVNHIRSSISIRSTRMHTRLNPNETIPTDSSMNRGGLNKSPYSTDQQPNYDWLAARKLLIRIMDHVQSISKWDNRNTLYFLGCLFLLGTRNIYPNIKEFELVNNAQILLYRHHKIKTHSCFLKNEYMTVDYQGYRISLRISRLTEILNFWSDSSFIHLVPSKNFDKEEKTKFAV